MEKESIKKKIDEAVLESVRKFTAEIEQRRIIFQSVLNENIDILLHSSEKWFGEQTPADFRKVLHSLFALANSFMLEEYEHDFKPDDVEKSRFDVNKVIVDLLAEFKSTFKFGNFNQESDSNVKYETLGSRERVRSALYNILIALYPFFEDSSVCDIKVEKEYSNIIAVISFSHLSEFFPGAVKIQRVFFPYLTGNRYRVGIGIYSAITGLKDAGIQVSIPGLNDEGSFKIIISFPTIEFLDSMDDMRSSEILLDRRTGASGQLLFASADYILEMVMTEFLTENGYRIKKADLSNYNTLKNPDSYKALIIDIEHLNKRKIDIEECIEKSSPFKRVIVINGSDDKIADILLDAGYIVLKKPIEVDEIMRILEGDDTS
jgi:hypothetical protein